MKKKKVDCERKMINITLQNIDKYEFEGSPDSIIAYLEGLKEKYPNVTDLSIDLDWNEYNIYFTLTGSRLETDKEFNQRIKQEEIWLKNQEKIKENKKQRELKELERLKKKYEKKN